MFLSACAQPEYEPGFIENENYYNTMAEFQMEKPASIGRSSIDAEDDYTKKTFPVFYNRAVEMGTADTLRLEYMLANEKMNVCIFSEKNVSDYTVIGFSELIKKAWDDNSDFKVIYDSDVQYEVPFKCLIFQNQDEEMRYYITVAADRFVYIIIQGRIDDLEKLDDIDNPMNHVSGYYP